MHVCFISHVYLPASLQQSYSSPAMIPIIWHIYRSLLHSITLIDRIVHIHAHIINIFFQLLVQDAHEKIWLKLFIVTSISQGTDDWI